MKKTLIFMSFIIFSFTIFILNFRAKALNSSYNNARDTVYYFTDTEPLLDQTEVSSISGSYDIVYDYKYYITDAELEDLYINNYFEYIEPEFIIIFQFQSFLHDSYLLYNIFSSIKCQGGKIMLLTAYNTTDYPYLSSSDYDIFMKTYLDELYVYVDGAIQDILVETNDDIGSINLLIDDKYFIVNNQLLPTTYVNLANNSYFFHIFFEIILQMNGITNSNYNYLINVFSPYFLNIHDGNGTYYTVLTSSYFTPYDNYNHTYDITFGTTTSNLFAFAMSTVDLNYYNYMYAIQDYQLSYNLDLLPVYLYVQDPVNFGNTGLIVETDVMLANNFCDYDYFKALTSDELEGLKDSCLSALYNLINN